MATNSGWRNRLAVFSASDRAMPCDVDVRRLTFVPSPGLLIHIADILVTEDNQRPATC
jgi:hypothetical protein